MGFSSKCRKGEINCRCRRAENGGEELQAKEAADDPQNKRLMGWGVEWWNPGKLAKSEIEM